MSEFKRLYDKVLSDSKFRARLSKDPSAALRSLKITPTPEVLEALKEVIENVNRLSKDLGAERGEMKTCVS
jgi:hypothetical protein